MAGGGGGRMAEGKGVTVDSNFLPAVAMAIDSGKMSSRRVMLVAGLLASCLSGAEVAGPPESWKRAFGDDRGKIWDAARENDGRVTADEVIAASYKLGSHHDGDRQLATAFALVELDDDPVPHLRKMMKETKPERRAFAVLVAGMMGDLRLMPDVRDLTQDQAKLGEFPGDWFWDTVADASKRALLDIKTGGVALAWLSSGAEPPAWIKRSNVSPASISTPEPAR